MTEVILPGLAGRLKPLRNEKKMTQKEMAALLDCTEGHYQKIGVWKDQSLCPPADGAGRLFRRHHRLFAGPGLTDGPVSCKLVISLPRRGKIRI